MERKFRKSRVGVVTSNSMDKSIAVSVVRKVKHPVYGKFMKKSKKLKLQHAGKMVSNIWKYQ